MLNIVLYEPEIALNTGNIGRSAVLSGSKLHLIRPFSFRLDDKLIKKAGMDYWKNVDLVIHDSYDDFLEYKKDGRLFFASTKSSKYYTEVEFKDGDYIMFGPESRGIPESILFDDNSPGVNIKIPMIETSLRSLNLANSVNIILFEALRQLNFPHMK